MTVEAKLKITPVLDQALAVLRTFVQGLEAVGETAKKADGQGAFDKTRTAVGALGTELDSAKKKIQATGEAAKAADTQGAMDKTRAAVDTLSGQLDGVKQKHDASGKAAKAADEGGSFGKTRQGLESISTKLQDIRTQFLAFLGLQQGVQAVSALAGMSDEYQSMRARLRLVTNGQEEFNTALRTTQGLSAKYNQPLAETSSLYTRLLSAVRPLGGGMREASVASEAMLASLKISGATTAEAGSAILQFSQAVGSGVLRGEEFNAINEAAPRLLDALAQGLGKPKSELKALAEQGALTTSAVVGALSKALPQLQREAASIPGTIGGAYEQVIAKVRQYMGAQVEANGLGSASIAVLKLIADNVSGIMTALQALSVLLLAGWLGRGAVALEAIALGAGGAAVGVNVLTASVGRLWLAIGGPVGGLIVAVYALSKAWDALGLSRKKASDRTDDDLSKETLEVQRQIKEFEDKKKDKTIDAPGRVQLMDLRRQAEYLKEETDKRNAAREGAAELEREGKRGGASSTLRDPASIKKFEDEYKLRGDIVKKFADERAVYILAKDKEIEAAQRLGNDREVAKLQKDKASYLKEQKHKEGKEVSAFDGRDATTRIAQTKVLYDKDFELLADATQREKKLLQEQFDQGLVGLEKYLTEKARLQNAESNQEVDRLIGKQVEEQRVLEINRKRLQSAKDGNGREQAREAVTANENKVAELTVEIEKAERKRLDNARELGVEGKKLTRELAQQAALLDTEIRQARGTETGEQIAARVKAQFAEQRKTFVGKGGDVALFDQTIEIKTKQEQFKRLEHELQIAQADLQAKESSVQIDQAAGLLTVEEAEKRILALRRQQLPVLQAIAAEVADKAQDLGPDEKLRVDQTRNQIKQLGDLRTDAEKTLRGGMSSGIGQFFTDVASGAKTVGDALRNMLSNFAMQMLNLIAQKLGAQLVESMMPGGGSGGGGGGMGSWINAGLSVFGFHSGGVVSEGGATFTRNINAAAFALAPRYHTGGIAGMAPRSDELYAVLQKGEEVLTKDDPRHVANYGKGSSAGGTAGGNVISVTVNGASGDEKSQGTAGADLGRMVESVVDQWAIKNSRPGGVLFKGR